MKIAAVIGFILAVSSISLAEATHSNEDIYKADDRKSPERLERMKVLRAAARQGLKGRLGVTVVSNDDVAYAGWLASYIRLSDGRTCKEFLYPHTEAPKDVLMSTGIQIAKLPISGETAYASYECKNDNDGIIAVKYIAP